MATGSVEKSFTGPRDLSQEEVDRRVVQAFKAAEGTRNPLRTAISRIVDQIPRPGELLRVL